MYLRTRKRFSVMHTSNPVRDRPIYVESAHLIQAYLQGCWKRARLHWLVCQASVTISSLSL